MLKSLKMLPKYGIENNLNEKFKKKKKNFSNRTISLISFLCFSDSHKKLKTGKTVHKIQKLSVKKNS